MGGQGTDQLNQHTCIRLKRAAGSDRRPFCCQRGAFKAVGLGGSLTIMATSKIEIIKRAASFTGFGALVSIEDNEEIARLTGEHYEAIAEEMLTEHGWKFARRVEPMQLTTHEPEKPWSQACLLYTSPSPRDRQKSRMPSSA